MICFNILTTNSYLWQLKFKAFELRIRMQSIANSYSHDIDLRLPRFSKLPPDIHLKEGFFDFCYKVIIDFDEAFLSTDLSQSFENTVMK